MELERKAPRKCRQKAKCAAKLAPRVRVERAVLAAVVLAVVAPIAHAAQADAQLAAEGVVEVTASEGGLATLALFAPDATRLDRLDIDAASVRVLRYTLTIAGPLDVAVDREEADFLLTNVTMTLTKRPEVGWIGGVASGDAQARLVASTFDVETATTSQLGLIQSGGAGPDDPASAAFAHTIDVPHVALATGLAGLEGTFYLKLYGPDFSVVAAENESRIETGESTTDATSLTRERTWVVLELNDADARFAPAIPAQAGGRHIDFAAATRVAARFVTGHVQTETTAYAADGGNDVLAGTLQVNVSPSATSRQSIVAATGELATTSLRMQPGAPGGAAGSTSWGLLLVGAVIVGALGGGALVMRRSRKSDNDADVDLLMDRMHRHAEEERWDAALDAADRAILLAPASARLWMERGYFLERLGRDDEALAAYEHSSALRETAEIAFLATRPLARAKRWNEAAEQALRALALEPSYALEAEHDEAWRALAAADARVARAIRDALARLE